VTLSDLERRDGRGLIFLTDLHNYTRIHRHRKRGYARDLTPQLFMWGDIDMYIPLEKSNTYPCKLYATRTEMLGKAPAVWTPLGNLQRSRKIPSWWGWDGCPSPRTPALGPSPLLPYPTPKLVPTLLLVSFDLVHGNTGGGEACFYSGLPRPNPNGKGPQHPQNF